MINASRPMQKIGQFVEEVGSWQPARDAPSQVIMYIDLGSVDNELKSIVHHQNILADEAPSRARQLVKTGDILVSTVRPNLNGVAAVPQDYDGATASTGFCVLRADNRGLLSRYLFHWVKGAAFIADMVRKATGQSYPAVSDRIIKDSEIPLPLIDEQRRIADILDQADALRRKRRESLQLLEALPHELFLEVFGDPETNPKGHRRCLLRDIIAFQGGSQPAKEHFLYEDSPDRVRFVQIRDFRTDDFKTYIPKELAKRPFSESDVMIGRYGPPVFQIFRGLSGTYNVALMKAAPKGNITKDFIFYLLQERKLHTFVVANSERTAGQSGVNLDLLENYPAFTPSNELLAQFGSVITKITEQISYYKRQLTELEALFASLQHRAFRGEI